MTSPDPKQWCLPVFIRTSPSSNLKMHDGSRQQRADLGLTLTVGENNACTSIRTRRGSGNRSTFLLCRTHLYTILQHRKFSGATCLSIQATCNWLPAATNKRLSLWPQVTADSGLPCKPHKAPVTEIRHFKDNS